MPFPDGNLYGWDLSVPAAQVPADYADFPLLLTAANLPSAMLDTDSGKACAAGGGDLRVYTDSTQATRLAIHVVSCTPAAGGGTAQIRVRHPNLSSSVDTGLSIFWGGGGSQPAAGDAYGQHATYPDEYKAWWTFEQTPAGAGSLLDSTQYANHGTPQGSMDASDLVDGQIGKAWDFDGADDLVTFAGESFVGSDLSVIGWIDTSKASGPHILGCYGVGGGYPGWGLGVGVTSPGRLQYYSSLSGWAGSTSTYTGSVLQCAISVSASSVAFYRNGTADGSSAASRPGDFSGSRSIASRSTSGSDGSPGGTYELPGTIDGLRIVSSALTADQITAHYRAESSPGTWITVGAEITLPVTSTGTGIVPLWGYYAG